MSDAFAVTASWGASSYTTGQTITATISGDDVVTTTTTTSGTAGPLTIPIIASDGATETISLASVPVSIVSTTTATDSVKINPAVAIIDQSPTPRTWTISSSGLSITATA
jgi:hypothetical protein